MKQSKTYALLAIVILFLMPVRTVSQTQGSKDSLHQIMVTAAKEIIMAAGTCTLITLDQDGRARARLMDAFLPENDFTVWFGTNPKSRKVKQIERDSKVTLFYRDRDDSGYVMICGKAQIVNDSNEKEKHWKPQWEPFYKDKQDGFVLIKVVPDWMEVVSNSRGILGDPDTWEPHRVIFSSIE